MPGPPCCAGCSAPGGRLVLFEGHPAEWLFDVDADGGWIATDYDYFAGPEASKGWAPEYIDQLSIADDDQHWKFARAWTLGEVITALLRSGLRVDASPSTRPTGGAATPTSARTSAAGSRCRSRCSPGATSTAGQAAGRSTDTHARSSASWMTVERSSASAWRSAGSRSASRSTRTPRAPMRAGDRREVDRAELGGHALARPAPLLPHPDRAVALVVEHEDDDPGALARRRSRARPCVIAMPAVADERHDRPVAMDERGGDRGRDAVAHRARRRTDERARAAEPEPAAGPAGEVAGIGGEDRVVGQDVRGAS